MSGISRIIAGVLITGICLGGLIGCSNDIQPVKVTGVLQVNGNAYSVGLSEQVFVVFISVSGLRAEGRLNTDATFTVSGPMQGAIPSGKYRVAITTRAIPGVEDDKGATKFSDFESKNTPLSIQIGGAESRHVLVDIGKKTVTTQ